MKKQKIKHKDRLEKLPGEIAKLEREKLVASTKHEQTDLPKQKEIPENKEFLKEPFIQEEIPEDKESLEEMPKQKKRTP